MQTFATVVRKPPQRIEQQYQAVKIAVIYPALQSSDYWRRSLDSFDNRLQQLGINYQIKTYFSRPSGDLVKQSKQLKDALKWQPDYLIFTLNSVPEKHLIERLLAKGKPKLILQNITTPLKQWLTNKPFMYVGFDHAQGTSLMAYWMLKEQSYQGDYLMLFYAQGYVSQMRGETFAEIASSYPGLRQVAAYYTDGDSNKAYIATKQSLAEHPELNMIFANSTDIALGALKALREAGKTKQIMLNGWGGGPNELAVLNKSGLDVTVMRVNDDNGIAMAEAIKMDITGDGDTVPHVFAGDIKLLPSDTNQATIEQLKKLSFRLSDLPSGAQAE